METLRLRWPDGSAVPLPRERWLGPATPVEERLLDRVLPPVLDVGCGTGRLVQALAERGIVALGVDAAPSAVAIAASRGVPVLRRSIFEPLPGTGRWGTAILLDGNIGIGGHPERLLLRLRQLLQENGRVLVEVDPPGATTSQAWPRLERGFERSAAFPWAQVSADRLHCLARRTGFVTAELLATTKRRWFGVLDRR